MKKLVMIALVVSLLLPIMAQQGQAAPAWYYCNCTQVGSAADGGWMVLEAVNQSFAAQWFPIAAGINNQALAAAFTAIANIRQVRAEIDFAATVPTVTGILLTNQ
jgi:hypothetical protein